MFPHGHYCVPIVAGQNLYGLLNVYLRKGHKRSDREETFLTSVASTLATGWRPYMATFLVAPDSESSSQIFRARGELFLASFRSIR